MIKEAIREKLELTTANFSPPSRHDSNLQPERTATPPTIIKKWIDPSDPNQDILEITLAHDSYFCTPPRLIENFDCKGTVLAHIRADQIQGKETFCQACLERVDVNIPSLLLTVDPEGYISKVAAFSK